MCVASCCVPGALPAPGTAAGNLKLGSKLKIKFKPAQAAAAAEPPADRSSQVQGDVRPAKLQPQPSLPSQVTGGTTGASQRPPGVKTKIKFTLPKDPRPLAAGAAGAAGAGAVQAAGAAAAAAGAGAGAGASAGVAAATAAGAGVPQQVPPIPAGAGQVCGCLARRCLNL